jgi:hypothetical protein
VSRLHRWFEGDTMLLEQTMTGTAIGDSSAYQETTGA